MIVWLQGGVNETDWTAKPGAWLTQWGSIMDTVRTAWLTANLPADNLSFVAMCTHDVTTYDFTTRRAQLIQFANTQSDLTVVNIPEIIPFASYSAFASGAHLSKAGYETIGSAIINRLL